MNIRRREADDNKLSTSLEGMDEFVDEQLQ